jgi:hypothetical protein
VSFNCKLCPDGTRCVSCRERNATERHRQRMGVKSATQILTEATRPDDPWLLPDDGVTDLQAVAIAVSGERAVRLTRGERLLAAQQILAYDGTEHDVIERLSLPELTPATS